MKTGFYARLAADSMRKNRRMFIPFILTCIGMVMMFYIIMFLAVSDALKNVTGEATLRQVFAMGSIVISIFSAIFLFYTNSFLMKRRKREFGLYNVLGMSKINISRIVFWEMLITAIISVCFGLLAGMAFSKLAELGLVNLIRGEVTYDLSVSVVAVKRSVQVFAMIFLLIFLNAVRQIRSSQAVLLMKSDNAGEKPPKGNGFIALTGAAVLAAAYYIAIKIKDPMTAFVTFFAAVIMVIIGTYLLMISGSVIICRILQKKKKYYYKPEHFVSVSSMLYRMKRNGAGLASICILSTMVLVMTASTSSLYFGEEDAVERRYPRDINMEFRMNDLSGLSEENIKKLNLSVFEKVNAYSIASENAYSYRCVSFSGTLVGNNAETEPEMIKASDMLTNMRTFFIIPLSDYNAMTGAYEVLNKGEAILYSYRNAYNEDKISFNGSSAIRIKKRLDSFLENGDSVANMTSSIYLIVPELEDVLSGLDVLADYHGERLIQLRWICGFDADTDAEQQIRLNSRLESTFTDGNLKENFGYDVCYMESRENERADFYSLFGSIFYIGIVLSLVFIIAAVLIIYYKQVAEGYEDIGRFSIMQNIGMTKKEIRKSINSQLLIVFFLPLALAAVHLAFAFPFMRKILLMFSFDNIALFARTTAASLGIFSVFYALVYRFTASAYYGIVSGMKEKS